MITVKNVTFGYTRKSKVLRDFSFEFKTGNIYGLLGRNGAGKTTLLRLLTGLLFPVEGACLLNNIEVTERLPETLKDICFLPEEYELPSISLEKYVQVNSVFYDKFSNEDLTRYITEFELDKKQKLNSMSYGQKKKFLIAFGLAANANFLMLDEPTNGLDIPSKSQFRKIIASVVSDERCIIISTHQVRDLENLIDPVVIIENGEIIFNQSIDDIATRLLFGDVDKYAGSEILYTVGMEGRKRGVMVNRNDAVTIVDLELLFNAVIQQKSKIQNIFNT